MRSACIPVLILAAAVFGSGCKKEGLVDQVAPLDSIAQSNWEYLGSPLGDSEINTITIHPEDDNLWFVTSWKGIYVTRNGGHSWKNYLNGYSPALSIDPNDPSRAFAGSGQNIYLSQDYGQSWTRMFTFPKAIESILVSEADSSVYVGIRWENSETANGIYKSTDGGSTWQYYSYNVTAKGLIPWDIEEDPVNKKIYVATEIYDHPQPYHPPFLRSSDGGVTWEDISGALPWHAIRVQVQPQTHNLYALLEGPGLYYSKNFGDTWQSLPVPFWLTFIIDKNNPQRFFGGNHVYAQSTGGVYQSDNAGVNFKSIGLEGHIAGSLCLNHNSTSLYLASYNSGIFRTKIK